jgi:uncharacterized membrane protein HdeD (DUF308 family)
VILYRMRFRARTIIAMLGCFVLLSGAMALVFAASAGGSAGGHGRGIVGGVITLLVGGVLTFAGVTGRMPESLRRLLDLED